MQHGLFFCAFKQRNVACAGLYEPPSILPIGPSLVRVVLAAERDKSGFGGTHAIRKSADLYFLSIDLPFRVIQP
ncbi:MAG: hypothetical protein FD130_692 [Halothiobacillaceae bacterium]|nr:MAG: hypothetical protein FD130_692 [Halothiobacillaceae bacterium]